MHLTQSQKSLLKSDDKRTRLAWRMAVTCVWGTADERGAVAEAAWARMRSEEVRERMRDVYGNVAFAGSAGSVELPCSAMVTLSTLIWQDVSLLWHQKTMATVSIW